MNFTWSSFDPYGSAYPNLFEAKGACIVSSCGSDYCAEEYVQWNGIITT